MSKLTFTTRTKERLDSGEPEKAAQSPFITQHGRLFMQFDSVLIENNEDGSGLLLSYCWKGEKLSFHPVFGTTLTPDTSLKINDLTGMFEVTFHR